ncbi:reverse transcriptase [Gossypium australe]|uniref:Reverse transcriptase n=1 Tax=Gossypium australe TaxID=47621 RepID=A0A5B6WZU6_9ROSI|nr:reverse transcriptase [Gossypium australe]
MNAFRKERGRLAGNNIRERLDRGVANQEWWDLFTGYSVTHLQHGFSYHCLVLVDTNEDERLQVNDRHRQFRFNVDWMLNKDLEEQVKQGWLPNGKDTLTKLSKLGVRLRKWAKKEKGLRERRTKDLNSRLLEFSSEEINDEVLTEITEAKLEMNLEADKEELF